MRLLPAPATRLPPWMLALCMLAACTTNIGHVPKAAVSVPTTVVLAASQDRVWSAARAALATGTAFKVQDKANGTLVTDYRTVDSQELSMLGTALLGKTYRANYTVKLRTLAPERTEMAVQVGVQVQQVGFVVRDEDNPALKGFMRQRLFDQIAAILQP